MRDTNNKSRKFQGRALPKSESEIYDFLEKVNLLPPTGSPATLREFYASMPVTEKNDLGENLSGLIDKWFESMKDFPAFVEHINRYCRDFPVFKSSRALIETLLEQALEMRAWFNAVEDLGKHFRQSQIAGGENFRHEDGRVVYSGKFTEDESDLTDGQPTGFLYLPIRIFAWFDGNPDNPPEFDFEATNIIESLRGLDPRRFRRCVICSTAFYAQRLDAECCSTEHAATKRQRDRRSNDEKRRADNEARRWKYQQEKKKRGAI
jgi:hypothetical protein